MAEKNSSAGMFDALTQGETWILSMKLMSGAAMSGHAVGGDHATTMEIHGVVADVQANFGKGRK